MARKKNQTIRSTNDAMQRKKMGRAWSKRMMLMLKEAKAAQTAKAQEENTI